MILPMSRVRMLGPRDLLTPVIEALQDFGRLQVDDTPREPSLSSVAESPRASRERRQLDRIVDDADAALEALGASREDADPGPPASRSEFAAWARHARRIRRAAERLQSRRAALEDERALAQRYRDFLEVFRGPLSELAGARHLTAYGVTVPAGERRRVEAVAARLQEDTGARAVIVTRPLPSGDLAVLIAVPAELRGPMERALATARISEVPLPPAYAGRTLTEAAPQMLERIEAIPRELAAVGEERASLSRREVAALHRTRAAARDRQAALAAARRTALTAHAFVLEGWLPTGDLSALRSALGARFAGRVAVEEVAREEWQHAGGAPVVLQNPSLFRPFETLVSMMPLPAYGSIDPTPFVAVSFPMLFGLMLGDVGYGLVMAVLALWLRAKTKPGKLGHTIAQIALPCAAFATVFGVLYGEFFGTLGTHLFQMHPLLLDREHAVVAAMLVAVGVGFAHIVLGLVLGVVSAGRGEPRVALSRIVQITMLLLVVASLLAAVEVLPHQLFGPFAIAVLVGFPVLLVLEGIIAPIEFFSTLGNILSYIRIMAIGTASVMLAVVANDMAGMVGSAVVGALFALLFHLVNFGLGIFSPTIHGLRLHYVEFFRQFYSPGGVRYAPLAHWHPDRRGVS